MDRRSVLALTVGLGAGCEVRDPRSAVVARADSGPTPKHTFEADARRVTELHRRQTKQTILALKAKYESPVLGRIRVWELLEKLALCTDPSDTSLGCVNQYMHVCQLTAALEQDGEADETMLLAALLHDLGKLAMLAGEAPEHVVCMNQPLEGVEPGGGLENTLFQFGHDEIAYSRLKDHVPEHVAWMVRYHAMDLGKAEPFMSPRDHELERTYLSKFRQYDAGAKSFWTRPHDGTLARYRDFIEERFPQPILF
ncbi:MAG: HDOD domain-containing protein [Bryobacterales bacterium]|nr:HDOD domain-containing protein [Bryobacterales bacterium]